MEGIWYAHFSVGQVKGDGITVLRNGEIQGGDPAHTYAGSYQEDGSNIYANVRVSPYTGSGIPADMDHPLVFFMMGSVAGDSARITGHADNRPELTVSVDMHRGA